MAKSKSLPFMPWFPANFMAATRGWSVTAKGVYRELMDAQWELGPLPEDPKELRKLIGATSKEWKAGWPKCEGKFPVNAGGGRLNPTLEAHRTKSASLSEMRRQIGHLGGKASAASRSKPEAKAEAITSPGIEAIASPIASSIAQATVNSPSSSLSEEEDQEPARSLAGPPARPAPPGPPSAISPFSEGAGEQSELALETDTPADTEPDADIDLDGVMIWTHGLEMMAGNKHARSILGKLVKTHGKRLVARKIGEVLGMERKPQDPVAYLMGTLQKFERRFMA